MDQEARRFLQIAQQDIITLKELLQYIVDSTRQLEVAGVPNSVIGNSLSKALSASVPGGIP